MVDSTQTRGVPFDWLDRFLEQSKHENLLVEAVPGTALRPARELRVDPEDWGGIARLAARTGLRWCGVWGEHRGPQLWVSACFEHQGDYLVVRTVVDVATPILPSHVPHYAAADRPERHLQDLFGIAFMDHPDVRRWVRHQAWPDKVYPLRSDCPAAGEPLPETRGDNTYPFLRAYGSGVYEIPVGPVHAGIIEPGHFRFQAVGETVLNLEARLGYAHKGIEKIAEGRDAVGLARLAARVSGDSTVAHAWAACMAMERAAGIEVPGRALAVRGVLAERERVANHLGDIGAICNDVGFAFAWYQFSRLRELWQRDSARVFGHRLLYDVIVPGGVVVDVAPEERAELSRRAADLRRELEELAVIVEENTALQDRLVGTGVLTLDAASRLGVLGYVARASGIGRDLRHDAPYAPYQDLDVRVPVFQEGDVAARVRVRVDEIRVALGLLEHLLDRLPDGGVRAPWQDPAEDAEGLGLVEGWRGEILCYVRFGAGGRVSRYFPRDPSWLNWPALEVLVRENIVPDFPVCNKSVNGSYSGHDL
ncbi:MAG: Ni,Fe-hydrogenase III large subunit [Chromatiales bacterium 21-64-14]|nr:MAG: Ni,Fe-hydrogenase III large subunit [Chromatiales bacterium 21-64-14]HQU15179.1 NADH-quinone oxidoreductase subunit C [Gammaproteobacteria bacterium]